MYKFLTTKSNLKLNKLYFSIIDELSFRVKNLYNSALYEIYNHYDSNKQYLNYNSMDKKMKNHETNFSYRKLNAQMSQQTLMKLDKNYSSFFALLKKKEIMIMINQLTNLNFYLKMVEKNLFSQKIHLE